MGWTYHNFEEETSDSARLTKLNQHITEVRAKIAADVSGAEFSRSSATLRAYLQDLYTRRDELEARSDRTDGNLVYRLGHARDRQ